MVKRSREDFDNHFIHENKESPDSAADISSSNSPSEPSVNGPESAKLFHIDTESGEGTAPIEVMRCSLPPHARQVLSFATFEDYEVHYNKLHVNRCAECRKNFPTPHFLDLHISENHNPLIDILKDRGERTYSCFVEDCDRKCSSPEKRRMHLIDKHMFPKDYDFYVVNDGIDQRSSMLKSGRHRRRSSAAQHKTEINDRIRRRTIVEAKTSGEDAKEDTIIINSSPVDQESRGTDTTKEVVKSQLQQDPDMDDLSGAMSALRFVPTSVRFGRGRGKGGFSRS